MTDGYTYGETVGLLGTCKILFCSVGFTLLIKYLHSQLMVEVNKQK